MRVGAGHIVARALDGCGRGLVCSCRCADLVGARAVGIDCCEAFWTVVIGGPDLRIHVVAVAVSGLVLGD